MKNFLNKYFSVIVALITSIAAFLVMRNVVMFGDDFYYHTFTTMDAGEFLSAHFGHYLKDNGRALVHILVTVFLKMPSVVWQVTNSVFLGLIVLLGSKIVIQKRTLSLRFMAIPVLLCCGIFYLNIDVTRQSVYWLTGSFNYVYPIVMLFVFWFFLIKRDILGKGGKAALFIFAFLASATAEQNAMMALGLSVLYLFLEFITEKKCPSKLLWITFAITVVGAASVFLAPATFVRMGIESEDSLPFLEMFIANAKDQYVRYFTEPYMFIYQKMFFITSAFFLWKISTSCNKNKSIILKALALCSIPVIKIIEYEMNHRSFSSPPVISPRKLLSLIIITVYLITVVFIIIRELYKTRESGYEVPAVALILGFGSQIMMYASPVFGPRVVLCGIIMSVIYSSSVLSFGLDLCKGKKLLSVLVALVLAVTSYYAASSMLTTINGYSVNYAVFEANEAEIDKWEDEGRSGELTQYMLVIPEYGWSMPYYSSYHLTYYMEYYDIPSDTVINWVEFQQ